MSLPPAQPPLDTAVGGVRAFIVRAGPSAQADSDYIKGYNEASGTPNSSLGIYASIQAVRVADGLHEVVVGGDGYSAFVRGGVRYMNERPIVLHDDNPKSIYMANRVMKAPRFWKEDGMERKPAGTKAVEWILQMLTTQEDATKLVPVIVVCGFATLRLLLAQAGMELKGYNVTANTGSLTVIDFPSPDTHCKPTIHTLGDTRMSVSLPGAWGNATAAKAAAAPAAAAGATAEESATMA